MKKADSDYRAFLDILKEELIPAGGCTEPIAIAYTAAVARKTLGCRPEHMDVYASGNLIKNAKGVYIPNGGELRGVDAAAILGALGGNADRMLEVLLDLPDAACRSRSSWTLRIRATLRISNRRYRSRSTATCRLRKRG